MPEVSFNVTAYNAYDNGNLDNSSSSSAWFGYAVAGPHRYVKSFKATIPAYDGDIDSITIGVSYKLSSGYTGDNYKKAGHTYQVAISTTTNQTLANGGLGAYASASGIIGSGTFTNSSAPSASTTQNSYVTIYPGSTNLSGKTIYIYFAGNAAEASVVQPTSVWGSYAYTKKESVTSTVLRVGTTSSSTSTRINATPAMSSFYWRVDGLEHAANNYTGFYLYKGTSISGFTNGMSSSTIPSGYIDSITSTSSFTGNTIYKANSNFPSSTFKIGSDTPIICIANFNGKLWRIGGSGNTPGPAYVNLSLSTWITNAFNVTISNIKTTTATITWKWKQGTNKNQYINHLQSASSSTSSSGATTNKSDLGWASISSGASSSSYTVKNLTPGTRNTVYLNVAPGRGNFYTRPKVKTYGCEPVVYISTDPDYESYNGSATVRSSSVTSDSITVTFNAPSTTNNLEDDYLYYFSSTDKGNGVSSLSYDLGISDGTSSKSAFSCSRSGLSAETSYSVYAYVKSYVTGLYYKVGSCTLTTDASSYTATITASDITTSHAKLSISNLSSETNLNTGWYISNTDTPYTTNLSYNLYVNSRAKSGSLSNLISNTSYTKYAYVYSTASKRYYKVGYVDFTTEAEKSPYSADIYVVDATSTSLTFNYDSLIPYVDHDQWIIGETYVAHGGIGDISPAVSVPNNPKTNLTIDNLSPNTSYTYYAYIRYQGEYFYIGTVTATTPDSTYTLTVSVAYLSDTTVSINASVSNKTDIIYWGIGPTGLDKNSNQLDGTITYYNLTPNTTYTVNTFIRNKNMSSDIACDTFTFKTLPKLSNVYMGSTEYEIVNPSNIKFNSDGTLDESSKFDLIIQ